MRQGWNGILPKEYIKELRNNLGLKLNTESRRTDVVYKTLVRELFELNHMSMLCHMMMEEPNVEPQVPSINRFCWELSFNKKFNKPVMDFINSTYSRRKFISLAQFKKDFFATFEEYLWRDDIEDLLYALESNHIVNLIISAGKIKGLKLI